MLKIKQDFPFAHDGVRVVHYFAGDDLPEDDPELVRVATEEGWIEPAGEDKSPAKSAKAMKAAPENKSE